MTRSVGIIFHPSEAPGTGCVADACAVLDRMGVPHWELPRAHGTGALMRDTQLVLTLGGDGTFMHGARLGAAHDVPVLGVNLGRLGFLTELEPKDLTSGLERFLRGDYRLEERTVVAADLVRGERKLKHFLGVNEAVVHKGAQGKLVRLQIEVNGQEVGTIDADGVLVASATGSTAYALALGGPVLQPALKGLLMVPMNPFALTVRPIVFPEGASLIVRLVLGDGMLTADGLLNRAMKQGDAVHLEPYRRSLKVVRFDGRDRFFQRLRDKIGWGTPLVPLR